MTSNSVNRNSDSLTVGELVETPHLGLSFLAGEAGAARRVHWAHVSELAAPASWLEGGELLISNGFSFPSGARSQARYLASLDGARAAGLALGVRHPKLLDALFSEAESRSFPLLRVDQSVPFQAITRLVAASAQDDNGRRLRVQIRIIDALWHSIISAGEAGELFRRLEHISGYRLYFVTGTGEPVLEGFPAAPEHVVPHLGGTSDAPSLPGGLAVRVPLRAGVDAFVVALERPGTEPAGLVAVRHIGTIASLQVAEQRRQRADQRRHGAEVLDDLFNGRLDGPQADERMASLGFKSGTPLVIVAIAPADGEALEELHHRLADRRVPHLLLVQDAAWLALPASAEALASCLAGLPLRAGASLPRGGLADWASARREAKWALSHGNSPGSTLQWYSPDEPATAWMPSDLSALSALVRRSLGPLIDYDTERNSEMVHTLRVFFAYERRLSEAASHLCIHKHTLSYRLRRIEELTGRDLSKMADMTEFWLALKALDTLESRSSREGVVQLTG